MIKQEFERKWLLKNSISKLDKSIEYLSSYAIDQFYPIDRPGLRLRLSVDNINKEKRYESIYKKEVSKGHFEEEILDIYPDEFHDIINNSICKHISKTRRKYSMGSHILEIDTYHNIKICKTLEIEFSDLQTMNDFKLPSSIQSCVIEEVTGNHNWSNANLAIVDIPNIMLT